MPIKLPNGKFRGQIRIKGHPRIDQVFDTKKAATKFEDGERERLEKNAPLYTLEMTFRQAWSAYHAVSKPFIPGMCRSITAGSGWGGSKNLTRSVPLLLLATPAMWLTPVRRQIFRHFNMICMRLAMALCSDSPEEPLLTRTDLTCNRASGQPWSVLTLA